MLQNRQKNKKKTNLFFFLFYIILYYNIPLTYPVTLSSKTKPATTHTYTGSPHAHQRHNRNHANHKISGITFSLTSIAIYQANRSGEPIIL